MSIPPINGSLLLLRGVMVAVMSCLLCTMRVLPQDLLLQTCKIPSPVIIDVSVSISGLVLLA